MANWEAKTSSDAAGASGREYQVFLNFRGEDTRHNFTDFLYDRLIDAGVHTFRDEEKLPAGDVISERLEHAINNSTLYIPIFSRNYASSKWCLRELKLMVDNVSNFKDQKSILPIFLLVKPDDVKLKISPDSDAPYKAAFEEHERKFPDEVGAWKRALEKVDEHKGWVVEKNTSQAAITKSVIKRVLEKLEIKQKLVIENLVGLDDRVKDLIELLDVNHRDVQLIVIHGMGGIGKTTIAKEVFNRLSFHFGKRCSFLKDVRKSSTEEGIVQLQKKLLSDIVDFDYAKEVEDSERGMRRIRDMLPTEKVLVVLDDVYYKEHIEMLIGNSSLCPGSRIIITTRNTNILQVEGFKGEIQPYEMQKMEDVHALQLFCQHAFGTNSPPDHFHGVSSDIVRRTGGLPLAITVIGSMLKEEEEEFWEETLINLREVPAEEILKVLKISYDDLNYNQKQIFLDIACFLVNEKKIDAIYMWADRGVCPRREIKVLIERCLIKILDNDKFWMHDQLIDLGRQIVHQESPNDLGKRSRLWMAKEAIEMIRTKEMKEEVQALQIYQPGASIEIRNEQLDKLPKLRFLRLDYGTYVGDFAKCHSKLKWLSWYPSIEHFRADNMNLDHLVVFKLYYSNFADDSKAWDLIKSAHNLKVVSLTFCSGITTIPDFSKCLGLERLTLENCQKLKRIESFIGDLKSLIELKISWCNGLTDLPKEVGELVKLKHFSLSGCFNLRELPDSLWSIASLIELDLSKTRIDKLPNSIEKLNSSCVLRLPRDRSVPKEHHVWQSPRGIGTLVNLEELDLDSQGVTGEIPVEIEESSPLRILNLACNHICGIPRTINKLHHLQTLNLRSCHEIQELPELPSSLTCLLFQSKSLLSVPDLSNLTNLVELRLSNHDDFGENSKPLTGGALWWIGRLSRLKKLVLDLADVLAPLGLLSLSHLEELNLGHLDLKALGQLPSSERNASALNFSQCEVEDIPLDGLPWLKKLSVKSCKGRCRLSISSELRKLQEVEVYECPELVVIQVVGGLSKSLASLKVRRCPFLTRISGLAYLKNLETLTIEGCRELTDVEGLNEMESLKYLRVTCCMSLRRLIDASCTKIPDDCQVMVLECGDYVKDSSLQGRFKSYKEEIPLDISNKVGRPFTIKFRVLPTRPSGRSSIINGWDVGREDVSPDSVTYEGLIAKVKCFTSTMALPSMWYNAAPEYPRLFVEIKSDEQAKGMVQVASKRGFIFLYVNEREMVRVAYKSGFIFV